jgi:hypothetical protein
MEKLLSKKRLRAIKMRAQSGGVQQAHLATSLIPLLPQPPSPRSCSINFSAFIYLFPFAISLRPSLSPASHYFRLLMPFIFLPLVLSVWGGERDPEIAHA